MEQWSHAKVQTLCQNPMTQGAGDCVGRVLKGSAYAVLLIRKHMVVMSQWAHSHLNLESPEASPACPIAMAAQRAKQEKAEGRCPCLVWKTSQWCVAYGNPDRPNRSTWVTWAHQIVGIHSSLLAKPSRSHGFECLQACVPAGAGSDFPE
jgi:hypothetical protein